MDKGNLIEQRLDRMEQMLQQVMQATDADLRSDMSSMEDRLATRLANLEAGLNRDRLIREGESAISLI